MMLQKYRWPEEERYINLTGLIQELNIDSILIHKQLWDRFLSQDTKINLIRVLDILKALFIGMNKTMPFIFNVDFGEEEIILKADFRIIDRAILIKFTGEK